MDIRYELNQIKSALECAERLADDKGSDLQYQIICDGYFAFRKIEKMDDMKSAWIDLIKPNPSSVTLAPDADVRHCNDK